MPKYPDSKIIQISTLLIPADGHPTLVTLALCENGSIWTITRVPSTGQFVGDGWQQYPTAVSNA